MNISNEAHFSAEGALLKQEEALVMDKFIYLPYIGTGLGLACAFAIGKHRNSGAWGYFGWTILGSFVGGAIGASIAYSSTEKEIKAAKAISDAKAAQQVTTKPAK